MVTYVKAKIIKKLVEFCGEDFRRIEHALSVLKHAERIAGTHSFFPERRKRQRVCLQNGK